MGYGEAAAQKTVTLSQKVNQAPAPAIRWNAPGPIPFGTPLSALQLDATSEAAGTFAYQPAAGAILAAGTGTLSVVFSPSNENYLRGSATVPITVVPPGSSTFNVALASAGSPSNPLRLQPGVPATVQLMVAPVGNFHQPVTLSCRSHLPGRLCALSPEVIRPTTTAVQVSLTLAPLKRAPVSRPTGELVPPNSSKAKGLLPSMTASALIGLLFFGRRRKRLTNLPATASALFALPLLALLSGCGDVGGWSIAPIEVQASSLVETQTLFIYVIGGDEIFTPSEGKHSYWLGGAER